jgi:hypothetical protein
MDSKSPALPYGIMPDATGRPREHDTTRADTTGGALERHPELPGNTVSCAARAVCAVQRKCRRWRDVTARHRWSVSARYRLFPGGVGNTQKDPARFTSLINDVSTKIFGRLPDTTWVYPGHGGDTTLGTERPNLAEWRERGW